MLKRIINITIWTIIGLYAAIVILLHIPSVQSLIGECASEALHRKFGTQVNIGRVDLGFFNRLIIDDSTMEDLNGQPMLRVSRISVKINPLALASGQIEITSAQFFGMHANLYKEAPESKPNFQFVVDSLASKDTTLQKKPLDLQVNSLIVRNSNVRWRILSRMDNGRTFSPNNIEASNISAHIIINRITDDSINVKIKRIALDERCGFTLKSLSLQAIAGPTGACLENMRIELPHTTISIPHIKATYNKINGKIDTKALAFNGNINIPRITPSDFAGFAPQLSRLDTPFSISIGFNGTGESITANSLRISTPDKNIQLTASGKITRRMRRTAWKARVARLGIKRGALDPFIEAFTNKSAPEIIGRLGNINIDASATGKQKDMDVNANVHTALGNLTLAIGKHDGRMDGHASTKLFDIGKMLADNKLGHISLDIALNGTGKDDMAVDGRMYDIDYNGYKYQDVNIKASYRGKKLEGNAAINDPNVQIAMEGLLDNSTKTPMAKLKANIQRFEPHTLHLTGKWPSTNFAANISCDIHGNNIDNASGNVAIDDFHMQTPDDTYGISNLTLKTGFNDGLHFVRMDSDFGDIEINGHFNYNTIAQSIKNMVANKLPTVPGLTRQTLKYNNDFNINASINDTEWIKHLFGIPFEIHRPLNISGEIDDANEKIDLWCDLPSFTYNGNQFSDAFVNIESPSDTLKADIRIKKLGDGGKYLALLVKAGASDNHLVTSLQFNNNEQHPLKGTINASTVFAKNESGVSTAYVDVLESRATIGDTTWHVMPSSIVYSKNRLHVNNFVVKHDRQHLTINGTATKSHDDSLTVELNDIDVSYILNLVNFHSVEFTGMASGKAYVAGAFSGKPRLSSGIRVNNFRFENGRMGTLHANVGYNDDEGRIEINATAKDEDRRTRINGYVSPRHNYIDLGIDAQNTRAEFMESFCGSFMDNVDVGIDGHVNVVGQLSNINLVGKAVVNGSLHMTALNTTYWLKNDSITFVPDEIKFMGDTLCDRNGNMGIMTGSVYHKHLTNLSYALNVKANNLLAYDTHTFGGNTFYGTAYVTGDCHVNGRSGAVTIDVWATPNKNSMLVYNAADQRETGNGDFITWRSRENAKADSTNANDNDDMVDIASDIRLNMHINCTPESTLRLLMDERTGDYITLNGEGMLQANYFNKGAFELYGNYIVDHGTYHLTVQNIIKKDFLFEKGSSIAFGGDPYNAALNLKAQYVLNSVSLADLNIGSSFSNNNVRVNCLMNITGSPKAPKVDFDLDMPSLGNDAKQMVYSLLNAEEEKNQQVLYLLAVGRFYAQNNNNDGTPQQYSQTSLAMQSFLSGTISQQLNDVLSNVINSNKWNFGANISTGTEGFNNAEYEGILSGRLLNNRLLINGQFGYRDNPNATTSFIGDFEIRYLLFPNGNLAINVYNKTNDRYFTRNSLNTQGLGLIIKKDFTRMSDLFFWRKKKKDKQ